MENRGLYRIATSHQPNTQVVDEHRYAASIAHLLDVPAHRYEAREALLDVTLTLEVDRASGVELVAVRAGSHRLGHLAATDTTRYRDAVARVERHGCELVTRARVWGMYADDWRGRITAFHTNVRVALPEPHLVTPVNQPPQAGHTIVPWGSAARVLLDQRAADRLARYTPEQDRALLLVTMHRHGGVDRRERIEVRLDGNRVGELSADDAARRFGIIDAAAARGLETAGWAHVQDCEGGPRLEVFAAEEDELGPAWASAGPVTVPSLSRPPLGTAARPRRSGARVARPAFAAGSTLAAGVSAIARGRLTAVLLAFRVSHLTH